MLRLSQSATKVTLSNVPPFIMDNFLCRKLSRHGKIVYTLRRIMSGCKFPLLKHVVSNLWQLYTILINRDEDLYVCFMVRVEAHVVEPRAAVDQFVRRAEGSGADGGDWWSPAPLRLHSSNRPGPIKAKKS